MARIKLTDVQKLLLSVLCEKPDKWHTRSDIANAAGYSNLGTYRANLLHDMADNGLVSVDETQRGVMTFYEYKPTPAGCEAIANDD